MQVIQTHEEAKPLKVLISAYACRPNNGSDPGIGWHTIRELVKQHQVWAITRNDNRPFIEAELAINPIPNLHFAYYDLPPWVQWWKREQRGVQFHYYLWQIGAYGLARKLYDEIGFDLSHHVTYVKYWGPSFLALLPAPFVWGPVGGGESGPKAFWQDFSLRGKTYETLRDIARWVGENDPFVRLTARRSVVALAATEETATRLSALGCKRVELCEVASLPEADFDSLMQLSTVCQKPRFISIGRLLHWKGFHLGLKAFAKANLPDAEYWVIGDGPEAKQLQELAEELGIAEQVKFWSKLPRDRTLQSLGQCLALVHPSLHESGGWVCLEAMAAGRPVICLDLGGPAIQGTEETGFKVPAQSPEQVVEDLAQIMTRLAQDPELQKRMGKAGQKRVAEVYGWENKGQFILKLYEDVLSLDKVKVPT
jgi:glycosyltransferase involved in cell wall biosynthesis